jgi:hypothetical protein
MGDPLRSFRIVWVALVMWVATYTLTAFGLMVWGPLDLSVIGTGAVRIVAGGVVLYMVAAVILRRRLVVSIPRNLDLDTRLQRYLVATIVGLAMLELGGSS